MMFAWYSKLPSIFIDNKTLSFKLQILTTKELDELSVHDFNYWGYSK
jgi:hypothetical protein